MRIQINKASLRSLRKSLADLPKELMKAAEVSTLRAGAKPIASAAKAKVPTNTGALKKSIGINVAKGKGSQIRTARVGPRAGFRGPSLGFKKDKKGSVRERFVTPNKYVHLVEFGSSRSAAKPFIRPAIDTSQGQVIDAMAAGLDKHLTRTTARLKRKAASRA